METTEPVPPARGLFTSEFWLAVLVLAAATVLRLADDIDADAWKWAVSSSTAAYAASRALVKRAQVTGEAVLASFKSDLALLAQAEAAPGGDAEKPTRRR